MMPCSTLPVATVPRPEMVKTSSTGIRKGFSISRTGSGTNESTASINLMMASSASASPSRALRADTRITGVSSPGNSYAVRSSRTSSSTSSSSSSSSIASTLLRATTIDGTPDLACEQDVLTRLGHRAVRGGDNKDRAVDLSGTRDHVLDVVGVARHVHVRVVALVGLVLDVGNVDRDPALLLFRRLVDLVEGDEGVVLGVALREDLGDRRGQGRLAVVDVPHRANVEVGLVALEFLLGH